MLRYKINKISEVSTNQLLDFYKKTYYRRHKTLTNNWRWWYRAGYNNFEPLVILIDNKIIGQAGLIPIDLSISKKIVPSIWFVDFAILSEYQNKGFGKILTQEWMKICPTQITFCNNQSLRIFKKMGWKSNFSTKRLVRPINVLNLLPIIKNIRLNFFNKSLRYFLKKKYFRENSLSIYKISDNYKVINDSFKLKKTMVNSKFAEIIRDQKWLNWRLLECPYKEDIYFFEYKNSFAIVHIFDDERVKKMNILYTYTTDFSYENELIILILNWSLNNNIDLIWLINNGNVFENIFPKTLNKPLNFASWSSDNKISDMLSNGLLDAQGIDSDIDSCLYNE